MLPELAVKPGIKHLYPCHADLRSNIIPFQYPILSQLIAGRFTLSWRQITEIAVRAAFLTQHNFFNISVDTK